MKDRVIADVLMEMGISPSLLGFNRIISVINVIKSHKIQKLEEAYSIVAEQENASTKSVEKAIRTAIGKINSASDGYKKYMSPCAISEKTYEIMVKPFLYILAYRL